jgi:hypothetical protein
MDELLADRVRTAELEIIRVLQASLYADPTPYVPTYLTFGQWLFKWEWRFRDAWSVLCGRADIC